MKNYLNYIKESINQLDELIRKCIKENCYKPLSVLDKEYVIRLILNEYPIKYINIKELIKYNFPLNIQDSDGNTILILSLSLNNYEIVKELIDAGADINIKNFHGNSALMHSALISKYLVKLEIIKLLIASGADVNNKNYNGITTLKFIERINNKNNIELIELLKSKGAKE